MRTWARWFWILILLWLGGVLQQAIASRYSVFGLRADFLLALLGPMCLLTRRSKATVFGFIAGLIQGAISGANLTHYIVSRCIAAFATASVARSGLQIGNVLAGLICAGTTMIAQLLLLFLAPTSDIMGTIGATIGTAVYNGVLAIPVYAILRRFAEPQSA